MKFLEDKKTYIAAVAMALGAFGLWLADQIDAGTLLQRLTEAAAIAGLRAGVAKAEL